MINIEVGILYRGNSLIQPIDGIELKRCITYKQLAKYKIRLLENIKKEDLEQVKQLPQEGSTYSMGACDVAIKNITLYVKSLEEILNEKDAVLKEKEKSIKMLQETTEQNVILQKEIDKREDNISELRDKIKDLTLLKDKNESEIEKLKKDYSALFDKFTAQTQLTITTQKELQNYKDNLGIAIEETQDKIGQREAELTKEYTDEIDRIQQIVNSKNSQIEERDKQIQELKRVNEELGKAGVIPDITFQYNGRATILGVCSKGSYGVSSLVYTLYRLIAEQKNVLIVDLDFKKGNIFKYIGSENKTIDNMLKGGALLTEHILRTQSGRICDYIGGVKQDWTPYDILNLNWSAIFDESKNYDYIICDCGIYGGYNIQSKICEFIARLGKMIYLHKEADDRIPNWINIKNFSRDNRGIPYVSRIISDNCSLYDNAITREFVKNLVLSEVVKRNES